MKKLIICLLALAGLINAKAQAPDIVHGINAGVSSNNYLYYYNWEENKLPIAPSLGYYLDIHMHGRTWLFMQFNFQYQHTKYTDNYYSPTNTPATYTSVSNYLDLYIPIRFAFRLGKEDTKFTFYPTAGFGLYVPVMAAYNSRYSNTQQYNEKNTYWFSSDDGVPFYPLMNIGFEAKWKFSQRNNLAIGFNSDYLIANNIIYLKFGWNKYKKDKKKE